LAVQTQLNPLLTPPAPTWWASCRCRAATKRRQVLCRGTGLGRAAGAPCLPAKHECELSTLKPGGAQSNRSDSLSTLHREGSFRRFAARWSSPCSPAGAQE